MANAAKTRDELLGTGECRDRDQELVRLVGRHGAMTIEQAQQGMGAGRTVTYRHFARCEDAGLVERLRIVGLGSVLRATRDGLRYAGLPLPLARISPGNVKHLLRCTSVAIEVGETFGYDVVLTEREILAAEAIEERPIASAKVGQQRGRPRMHRADLAVLTEQGTIAIEVELTPKTPRRLEAIIRAWRMAIVAGTLAEVRYLCAPGQTQRAIERAVARVRAEDFISVTELSR